MRKFIDPHTPGTRRVSIEGRVFDSMHSVYTVARHNGFTGCEQTISARLRSGATTWKELLAPVKDISNSVKTLHVIRAKRKDEMKQLMAELDARKAALNESR